MRGLRTEIPSKNASSYVRKHARELGYRMPAEWEPHEATWLAWPHNPEDWPGKFQAIPWLYAEIVRLLAAHELVHLLVEDARPNSACVEFWSARERISTA
jgi:agmatine/peptidylarginine deiminase